jgi:hypothetical protein
MRIIPEEVNFCAIMYRVKEIDGMIIFSESYGMYGCCNRVSFHRPEFANWQLEVYPTFGRMMVSHIVEMFKLVCKWRGDDFGREIKDEKEI